MLEISYKGTFYHGWQIQINANSVQQELNSALKKILKADIITYGSGRTDKGVHAEQQYVHFDFEIIHNIDKFIFQLNAILPKDIYAKRILVVDSNFNARHDPLYRSYEYRISLQKNPFLENLCCFYFQRNLNIEIMNQSAELLLQHSDFQSFSKYKTDVENFNCTISTAIWKYENDLLIFHITANRFLRGMVRAIVGTLLEVGIGKLNKQDFENIILKKDRCAAKYAAPPQGLFLTKVQYNFT